MFNKKLYFNKYNVLYIYVANHPTSSHLSFAEIKFDTSNVDIHKDEIIIC